MTPEMSFSLEGIIFPERGKIPRNDLFIVVADDNPTTAATIADMAETACTSLSLKPKRVHIAQGAEDLFRAVLTGNEGRPATAVFCDYNLYPDEPMWKPYRASLTKLGISSEMPAFSLQADGVHLAMIARALGYKGSWCLVSDGPPTPLEIIGEVRKLSRAVPSYLLRFPVDGFIAKSSIGGIVSFGMEIEPSGSWKSEFMSGNLSDAIAHLLRPRIAS